MALLSRPGKLHRFELAAQLLRGVQRLRHGRIRQQTGEFLAAEPAEQIARPYRRRNQVAERLEHAIAGLMPGRVVDLLEAIEIEQQQRRGPAIGDRPFEQRAAEIEERAAIGDPGQRIGERGFALRQFRPFLRHGDAQERQAESGEQRLKSHHVDDGAVRLTAGQ